MDRLILWSLAVGNAAILLAQMGRDGALRPEHLGLPALYTAAYLLSTLWLVRRGGRDAIDPLLIGTVCSLTGFGLAALVRLDADLAFRQARWVAIGLALFTAISMGRPWEWVRSYRYVWAAGGLLLLLAAALFGVKSGGARSWLDLGPLSFQPVEIAKICVVLFLSSYLAENRIYLSHAPGTRRALPRLEHFGPIAVIASLFAFVLAAQRDLGAALILIGLCVWMLTAATGRAFYAAAGGALAAVGGGAAVLMFDHVRTRFQVWIDPWSSADGAGYQIVESMYALAGGGFFGTGWGLGLGERIPAVGTDFIYSLIVEETGFVGAAGLLFLLALFCIRSLEASFDQSAEDYVRLGAAGFSFLFALQTFLIVGGVMRLLPVTGVTLPFVSYGGSSMIASFIQMGFVHSAVVSRRVRAQASDEVHTWIEA